MYRVLVADDNKDLLNILELAILEKGYDVKCVTSKKELLSELKTFNPDLLILDVFLNKYDGREICKEIRHSLNKNQLPIILISGNPYSLEVYKSCGAVDYLHKPLDLFELLHKIEQYKESLVMH